MRFKSLKFARKVPDIFNLRNFLEDMELFEFEKSNLF